MKNAKKRCKHKHLIPSVLYHTDWKPTRLRLPSVRISEGKRLLMGLQKAVFRSVKGKLSQYKRPPFADDIVKTHIVTGRTRVLQPDNPGLQLFSAWNQNVKIREKSVKNTAFISSCNILAWYSLHGGTHCLTGLRLTLSPKPAHSRPPQRRMPMRPVLQATPAKYAETLCLNGRSLPIRFTLFN